MMIPYATYGCRSRYNPIFSEPQEPTYGKRTARVKKALEKKADPVYLDFRSDYCWKKVLAEDGAEPLVLHLLNAILEPRKPFKSVHYENVEKQPEVRSGKKTYYDIYLKTETGEKLLLEMQREGQDFFIERLIVYCSRSISNQVKSGQKNYKFNSVIALAFLDFDLTPRPTKDYHHILDQKWRNSSQEVNNKMEIHVIEIKKFKKRINELVSDKDKWMYLIKNLGKMRSIPKIFDNDTFRPVFERGQFSNLNEKEKMDYLTTIDHERDEYNQLAYREKIGLKKGQRIGRLKGREEKENEMTEKMISNCLEQNLDIDLIANIVNSSKEAVEKIREKLEKGMGQP